MVIPDFLAFLDFPGFLDIQASADFLVSVVFLAFLDSQVSAGIQGFQATQAQAYRDIRAPVFQAFQARVGTRAYQVTQA